MSGMLEKMFADEPNRMRRGDRWELLKEALDASIARHDTRRDGFVRAPRGAAAEGYNGPIGIVKNAGSAGRVQRERMEQVAEQFAGVAKSMSTEEQRQVEAALAELRELTADVYKDVTVVSPGDLHPYDLEGPAKHMVPRFRIFGAELPRVKGQGTAREYRRILGYSNAGVGGVPDQSIFFSSESDTNAPLFGQVALRRGAKIEYAMDVHTLAYQEASVSDMVTHKAQFANLGYENSRGLSQMALLWAHMLGEEKALLYARGPSSLGFEGAVAAPAISQASSATGGSIAAGTYLIKVTARAGGGESVPSAEVATAALTGSTNTITVTVTTEPTGALGYNLYVTSGATGTETFQTSFVGNSFTMTSFVAGGAAPPSVDSTSNPNAYDGFLSVLADPAQAGYVQRVNAPLFVQGGSSNLGDKPIQDATAALFAQVYADPEEVWLNAVQRRELADWVRSDTTGASSFRITLKDGDDGVKIGTMVSGILNESSPTDRMMDLRVHPYMPSGCAFIRSAVLDVPNSGIGDTTQIIEVQGYMSVDWPQIQFSYDSSTYWFGAPIHYAPKWSACLLGLQ